MKNLDSSSYVWTQWYESVVDHIKPSHHASLTIRVPAETQMSMSPTTPATPE